MRPAVSACIVTLNEEPRIADCIRSVAWCDEIVVVDAQSSDATRAVAAAHGARVLERAWSGYVPQKDFAVRHAAHDWVFCIDADERVSPALTEEIVALRDGGFTAASGWGMPRLTCYFGRWIRHGTWYPDRCLRLFDRRVGRWGGTEPHAHVQLAGAVGDLVHPLWHFPYRTVAEHLETIDDYTTIIAQAWYQQGRRASLADLVLRPWAEFLRFYVLRLGCLDGWHGLLLAYLHAYYVRMKCAKLLVLERAPVPPPEHGGGQGEVA